MKKIMKIIMKAVAMSKTFVQPQWSQQHLQLKKRQTQGHRRLHVMCPYILVFLMVKTKRVPCYKN